MSVSLVRLVNEQKKFISILFQLFYVRFDYDIVMHSLNFHGNDCN